jgi:transcriptional regulator with XRE-family HTH domain
LGVASLKHYPEIGDRIRRRLKERQLSQLALAKAAGLSRQTLTRAINHDALSAETLRRIEDVIGSVSVVGDWPDPTVEIEHTIRRIRRASLTFANATDLNQWANRRDAQDTFPQLIRRLVLATVDNVTHIDFRAHEGVQLAGFDGRVSVMSGNAFVPTGNSVWELGTGRDPRSKADSDYNKRTNEIEPSTRAASALVFATPRRWPGKNDWVDEKRAEGIWSDVRVLDADDITTWLEETPAVHIWFSSLIGLLPDGVLDIESWFSSWQLATNPALAHEFLLAGRKEYSAKVVEWLGHPHRPLVVRSESRNESIAFVASVFSSLALEQGSESMARSVIVENESAWRRLVATRRSLVLIPTFDASGVAGAALKSGHSIVIPHGEGDADVDGQIELPPLPRSEIVELLESAGIKHDRAYALAGVARRSLTALRRQIGVAPSLQRPTWSRPEFARSLLPILLAGGWDSRLSGDRSLLEGLSKKKYDEVLSDILPHSRSSDPIVRTRGSLFYLVSPLDAWTLLARFLTRDDLERFRNAALEVLARPHPQYDLPEDQRWMADIYGKRSEYSQLLRLSISRSLAVAAMIVGRSLSTSSSQTDYQSLDAVVRHVVREVLTTANKDWRVWATLSNVLGDLAEASPDDFLQAVEAGIRETTSPIVSLFTDSRDPLFSSSPHTGLLWALERLAWSPDHFSRVVRILVELTVKDPGGRLINRPKASLESIYRPWLPQTSARLDQRFRVLDELSQREPEVIWNLLMSGLPEMHSVGSYAARPKWRNWDSAAEQKVSGVDYEAAIAGSVDRLLRLAGTSGARWGSLIERLPFLRARQFEQVTAALSALDPNNISAEDKLAIWDALRTFVARHRRFPDADWRLPEKFLKPIDRLRTRFEPSSAISKFAWLFSWDAQLPQRRAKPADHRESENELNAARAEAIREIAGSNEYDAILSLAKAARQPELVGRAANDAGLLADSVDRIVRECLDAEDRSVDLFAKYFLANRVTADRSSIESTATRLIGLPTKQRASLFALLPADPRTWEIVESIGKDLEQEYWSRIQWIQNESDIERALERLLKFGYLTNALSLIGMYSYHTIIDSRLILEALERALAGEGDLRPIASTFGHQLVRLLEQLTRDPTIDRMTVARLEWGFYPIIEHERHEPLVLLEALAEDPDFFVQLVTLAYKSEDPKEDLVDDVDQRQHASRAFSLLHDFKTIPGRRPDGTIDGDKLFQWVETTREKLRASKRLQIGDQQIGSMLSAAPHDADGAWPAAPVRAVIESVQSDDLEIGFSVGKYNSRGVISRTINGGGSQERAIAERYASYGAAVADTAPRTASMLRRMSEEYFAEARREDTRAQIDQDLDY